MKRMGLQCLGKTTGAWWRDPGRQPRVPGHGIQPVAMQLSRQGEGFGVWGRLMIREKMPPDSHLS